MIEAAPARVREMQEGSSAAPVKQQGFKIIIFIWAFVTPTSRAPEIYCVSSSEILVSLGGP